MLYYVEMQFHLGRTYRKPRMTPSGSASGSAQQSGCDVDFIGLGAPKPKPDRTSGVWGLGSGFADLGFF